MSIALVVDDDEFGIVGSLRLERDRANARRRSMAQTFDDRMPPSLDQGVLFAHQGSSSSDLHRSSGVDGIAMEAENRLPRGDNLAHGDRNAMSDTASDDSRLTGESNPQGSQVGGEQTVEGTPATSGDKPRTGQTRPSCRPGHRLKRGEDTIGIVSAAMWHKSVGSLQSKTKSSGTQSDVGESHSCSGCQQVGHRARRVTVQGVVYMACPYGGCPWANIDCSVCAEDAGPGLVVRMVPFSAGFSRRQ